MTPISMKANTTLATAIPTMAPGARCAVVRGVSTSMGDRKDVVVGFVLEPSAVLLPPSSVGNPWPGMIMKSDFFAAAFWMSNDTEEFWSSGGWDQLINFVSIKGVLGRRERIHTGFMTPSI